MLSNTSSFTSVSPTSSSATTGNLPPRAPPNSFAASTNLYDPDPARSTANNTLGLTSLELDNIDVSLANSAAARQRRQEGSFGSELAVPPVGGYFSASLPGQGGYIPGSPGGTGGGMISSSEDEDGFDTFDTNPVWGPSSSNGGGGGASGTLAYVENPGAGDYALKDTPTGAAPGGAAGGGKTGFSDPNKLILQGYLMKQGKRRNWRKRWFILSSGSLSYTRSHMVSLLFLLSHRARRIVGLTMVSIRARRTSRSIDRFRWRGFSTLSSTMLLLLLLIPPHDDHSPLPVLSRPRPSPLPPSPLLQTTTTPLQHQATQQQPNP